ncbi:hypothetical protein IID19_05155 [Patescibacteria group bacterium]|nr:hypothetical protein [Patescibacteria group bacterium]
MNCIGLIPARSGSKRILNKNVRLLDGHPLLAYSIRSALDSGVFESVVVFFSFPPVRSDNHLSELHW